MLENRLLRAAIGLRAFIRSSVARRHCSSTSSSTVFSDAPTSILSTDNYEKSYYLEAKNIPEIVANIRSRNLRQLLKKIEHCATDEQYLKVFADNLDTLPNRIHPRWTTTNVSLDMPIESFIIQTLGEEKWFDKPPKKSENIARGIGQLYNSKHDNLGRVGGQRAYSWFGDLARLERALIDWTMDTLISKYKFTPIVVPNLVYEDVLQGCGYNPRTDASQIYRLTIDREIGHNICLIGTSEMPLTAFHLGHTFEDELPKIYCCLSRCYRAEVKSIAKESGVYRVPYFNKVEMYGLTESDQSDQLLDTFLEIQKYLYTALGLHFRVIDMPPAELGLSAYRKYDIETWLQASKYWGEVSSASSCTDFQSRRFNIRYRKLEPNYETNEPFRVEFVHTINGTACAVPRLLLAVIEQHQYRTTGAQSAIRIPEVLQPYMDGQKEIKDERIEFFSS